MSIKEDKIIEAYNNGQSLNSIAKEFNTYPTSVRRILERNNIELRHDTFAKGSHSILNDGEKLIEWAKAQGRLVTKAELAAVIGRKRLSPSYFIKYPKLGQYVKSYEQQELLEYTEQLFNWLKENNIPYKPNDKTALEGVSVQALLLGEYNGILIVVDIKPKSMSKKRYNEIIQRRVDKAKEKGSIIVFLKEEHFENLDIIKDILDTAKTDSINIDLKKTKIENSEKIKDIISFSIAEYLEKIGCIDEEMAKKYCTMNGERIKIIQKLFKKTIKIADFDIQLKVLKYVQGYVKKFYNVASAEQSFTEKILDELLGYISFYDPKYVKELERNTFTKNKGKIELPEIILYKGTKYIDIGNIEQSIIKDKSIVKDLFSYPARKVEYGVLNKEVLSDNSISMLECIISECVKTSKLSLADDLMELLYNSNPNFITYEFYSSLINSLDRSEINLKAEQNEFLAKWKSYRKWII